jgi:hypothetical protein
VSSAGEALVGATAGEGDEPAGSAGRISGVSDGRAERFSPAVERTGDGDVGFFFFLCGLAAFVGDFFGVNFAFGVFVGVTVALGFGCGVFVAVAVGVAVGNGFFFFLVLGFGVGVDDGVGVSRALPWCAGVSSVSCARRQIEPVAATKRIKAANQNRNAATLAQGKHRTSRDQSPNRWAIKLVARPQQAIALRGRVPARAGELRLICRRATETGR